MTWRIKRRCVLLWQSSIAVEDFPVANDLRYLFKVRTKMRRDWRLQAIWHLRQIAHEQHPENLSLMLGDHCKYPSYDYAQLDKNMPDLPTLCSEFPPESAHFFYIRHHSPSKNIQKKSHQKICLSVSDAMDSVSSQTVDPNRHHSPRFTGPVPLQPLNLHII